MAKARTKAEKRYQTLKGAIKAHNMTQRELADLLGVHETFISKMVHGDRRPSLALALKIQRLINVELSELA